MHDSLAQAYHWTHDDICRLTMPQITMYYHAAWVNYERSDRRSKARVGKSEGTKPYSLTKKAEKDPYIHETGCTMSELKEKPEMFEHYMNDWSGFTA
jgi:hypothetical protein